MNNSENKSTAFSPFWPMFIVFVAFALIQVVQLQQNIQMRRQLKAARAELSTVLPQAQSIDQTVEKVGRELLTLSDNKSTEATRIIEEFKIKLSNPTPPPPAK